jgi:hypothetical protein
MVQTIDVIKGLKSGKPLSTPTAFKSAITWRNHQNQQYSVDFSFESTILNYYIIFFIVTLLCSKGKSIIIMKLKTWKPFFTSSS